MDMPLNKQLNVRLADEAERALKAAAEREYVSTSLFVRRLIMRELHIPMKSRGQAEERAA